MKETEVWFSIVGKPNTTLINIEIDNIFVEVQDMLNEHANIIVHDLPNELPLVRSISHHIDLILGASFPNKATYRMTPRDNEEIRHQV